jgi:hypothetical protein
MNEGEISEKKERSLLPCHIGRYKYLARLLVHSF